MNDRAVRLEQRLRDSLKQDRQHPSRCSEAEDGTVLVRPSGTSLGLAVALAAETGEDEIEAMNRIGNTKERPMILEGATVESTAEGDYLHIVTSDEGFVSFELNEDGASEVIDVLREWLRERREQ